MTDFTLVCGHVMQDPESRYLVADLTPAHLEIPGHEWAAASALWRVVTAIAQQDEQDDAVRRIIPARVMQAAPSMDAAAVEAIYRDGMKNPQEFEPAAQRLIERWRLLTLQRGTAHAADVAADAMKRGDFFEGRARAMARVSDAEAQIMASEGAVGVRTPDEESHAIAELQALRADSPTGAMGLTTDWQHFDRMHKGLRPGRVHYTIAPSGLGKTMFELNLMDRLAKVSRFNRREFRGLYINNEMLPEDMLTRRACIATGGQRTLDQWEAGKVEPGIVQRAQQEVFHSGVFCTPPGHRTAGEISALIARYAIRENVKVVVIDHMLDVDADPDEAREARGQLWRLHPKWVTSWQRVAQKYGVCIEIVGMCSGDYIADRPGKEPDPFAMQGAKAVINRVDAFRVLWTADDGKKVCSVHKNRGGACGSLSFDVNLRTGVWVERGYYVRPDKDGK